MILVRLALLGPFFVILDILHVFIMIGPNFVDDGGKNWEYEAGFIVHCVAAGLMIILEISDCF